MKDWVGACGQHGFFVLQRRLGLFVFRRIPVLVFGLKYCLWFPLTSCPVVCLAAVDAD